MGRNLHSLIRDLQRRKARERRGLVLAEGLRLAQDAVASGVEVVALLAADDVAGGAAAALLDAARQRGIEVQLTGRRDFDLLADTETPSGVMAVVAWEPLSLDHAPVPQRDGAPALVLDAVQDPGNVGTMIRTAHALGAWLTVALDGTADVRNPKTLRAAMGSAFRHPVSVATFDEFSRYAAERRVVLYLAAMNGEPVSKAEAPSDPSALVVGSEGHGVRPEWSKLAHRRVAVPMRAGAESLNAAVACGILLYELTGAGHR
jgi:TrmH family RNA methyltransferase